MKLRHQEDSGENVLSIALSWKNLTCEYTLDLNWEDPPDKLKVWLPFEARLELL